MLATTLIVFRALKPEDFGTYAGLAGTAVLASFCWDLGVSPVLTREVAAGAINLRSLLIRGSVLRGTTLPLWILVFSTGTWVLAHKSAVPLVALGGFAGSSLLYGVSMLLYAALRGRLQFGLAELSIAAGRLTSALISLFALPVVGFSLGLGFLALAICAGELVTLLVAAFFLVRARPAPTLRSEISNANARERLTLKEAVPFAANGMMVMAYNRFDVVIVAALSSAQELALYAPASRLQDALQLIPGSFLAIGMPIFAQASNGKDGAAHVQNLVWKLTLAALLIVIPITVVSFALTPWLLATVMGPAYLGATLATRILICSLPFNAILIPLIGALAGTGRAVDTTKVVAVTTVVALTGHLSLDWWLGATGGAIASLMRDPAAMIAAIVLARRAGLYEGAMFHRGIAPQAAAIASVE